ncbi:hypothetical protein DSO57_1019316 [Entomophthora muscae]|uniref:Uncharacterized protein n=1 Tax=Entomophthora muscae TaxID=34485 RepID=A0ACC2TQY0_9FUNG|nr:hypothetical protein DSO57_1019316 [Entomophthora muscae]
MKKAAELCKEEHHWDLTASVVATKVLPLPANVSYNTQGALKELLHNIYNNMDQSDYDVELWTISPN